jgi:hypothetical protein
MAMAISMAKINNNGNINKKTAVYTSTTYFLLPSKTLATTYFLLPSPF